MDQLLVLTGFLAALTNGFVIDTKLDLPYPKLADSVPVDSSLSPKLVKALYEVTFQLSPTGHQKQHNIQLVSLDGRPCQGDQCSYFVPANNPIVVRVDDVVDNLVTKKTGDEVPVIQGFDPAKIKEVVDAFNKSVREQADNRIKITPKPSTTTESPDDTTVPVYKGTVDTEAVLNQSEPPSTARPVQKPYYPTYKPHYPQYHYQRPYNQYPPSNGPYNRPSWDYNPCLIAPCYYNNHRDRFGQKPVQSYRR